MKNKRILIIFLNLLLLSVLLLSSCEGEKRKLLDSGDCGKDVVWKFYDDGTLVLSGTGEMYNLGENGAQWKKNEEEILHLVVENGVTQICDEAFSGLLYLRSADIADSVTEIGSRAFAECPCLTTVRLPETLEILESGLFSGCETLADIELPQTLLNIEDYAFAQCNNITNIVLPSAVQSLGEYAFQNCSNLVSISLPAGVINIADTVFYSCDSLTDVYLEDISTWLFLKSKSHSQGTEKQVNLHLDGEPITELIIPDTVTAISNYAFSGWNNLKSVIIPETVTSIGDHAFENCKSLESIVIPESVRTVGEASFRSCVNLKEVKISEGVEHIENFAFENCSSLESIVVPTTANKIGRDAFRGCTSLSGISAKLDLCHLIGRCYYEIENELGEPSGTEWVHGATVCFDQNNLHCGFYAYTDVNVLPDRYDFCMVLGCRLGYFIEGLEDGTYTFGELMPVFSSVGMELEREEVDEINGGYFYGVNLNNGYSFFLKGEEKNLITVDSSEYITIKNYH